MRTGLSILFIVAMLALVYFLWRFLMMRAMRRVVAVFRANKATNAKRAATLEKMGLQEGKGLVGNAFKRRDYRQIAMRIMGQEGVIRMVEGERFYLSEETLETSRVKKFGRIE
jgi:hypothetical protein